MLSLKLLTQYSPLTIVETRRKNYQALSQALRFVPELEFLFAELPEGVCPIGFPILVDNRRKLVSELNARGIAAIPWWAGYHCRLRWDEFPEARFLKNHLLMLPIHQQMTIRHIDYVAECVKSLVCDVRG
jgi:dTDP-4-amino-4,6-dideoxygalactose transaminase